MNERDLAAMLVVRNLNHCGVHQSTRDKICGMCGAEMSPGTTWCSSCCLSVRPKNKPCQYCGI